MSLLLSLLQKRCVLPKVYFSLLHYIPLKTEAEKIHIGFNSSLSESVLQNGSSAKEITRLISGWHSDIAAVCYIKPSCDLH